MTKPTVEILKLTNWPPAPNDPRLVELVKAMARDQARRDHEAEMQALADKKAQKVA